MQTQSDIMVHVKVDLPSILKNVWVQKSVPKRSQVSHSYKKPVSQRTAILKSINIPKMQVCVHVINFYWLITSCLEFKML